MVLEFKVVLEQSGCWTSSELLELGKLKVLFYLERKFLKNLF